MTVHITSGSNTLKTVDGVCQELFVVENLRLKRYHQDCTMGCGLLASLAKIDSISAQAKHKVT